MSSEVAVVGMAGRFPRSRDLDAFWKNIADGASCISELPGEKTPGTVNFRGVLEGIDLFDGDFFAIPPGECAILDPQHRLMLECVWHALEDAGIDPASSGDDISVYAAAAPSTYLAPGEIDSDGLSLADRYQLMLANSTDFLATRVSYRLNLRGESMTVQTGCSSSLVAVHMACQALLSGQARVAIAGGVTIACDQSAGYLYQEGMIVSPDGHCRVFDKKAAGTVPGSGVGVVVLKLLEDAVADGDRIRAVIKGSAVNNDGRSKAGFMAPSVRGQSEVIATALRAAGVSADSIGYVETHGTATPLGDSIELEALRRVFRLDSKRSEFCALGALKANFGHMDRAAGIAGLIKAVLCLERGMIPPLVDFEEPHPQLDLRGSPFFVPKKPRPWAGVPRLAGVSSFGVGGTNAHLVLGEAPLQAPGSMVFGRSRRCLVVLSARSEEALKSTASELAGYLERFPDTQAASMAWTRNLRRAQLPFRRAVAATTAAELAERLREPGDGRCAGPEPLPVTFMFPGVGLPSLCAAKELYHSHPAYRDSIDRCVEILGPLLKQDARSLIFDEAGGSRPMGTYQPVLLALEYALARLWMRLGVEPALMIGHSVGEYAAACLAGVFSIEDALKIVAERGRLCERYASGGMLSVAMPFEAVAARLRDDVDIAVVNAPDLVVVSGPLRAIRAYEDEFRRDGVRASLVSTVFAAHSRLLDSAAGEFREIVSSVKLSPNRMPFVSCLSGRLVTPEEVVDPDYWVRHLRQRVEFARGLETIRSRGPGILLESGPGQMLVNLAMRQGRPEFVGAVASFKRNASHLMPADEAILGALGELWTAGAKVDWRRAMESKDGVPIGIPGYPFQRRRHWRSRPSPGPARKSVDGAGRSSDAGEWFFRPSWERAAPVEPELADLSRRRILLIGNPGAGALMERLLAAGAAVAVWPAPEGFGLPTDVIDLRHLAPMSEPEAPDFADSALERSFWEPLRTLRTLSSAGGSILLIVASRGLRSLSPDDRVSLGRSFLIGLQKAAAQEYGGIDWISLDWSEPFSEREFVEEMLLELRRKTHPAEQAIRGRERWVLSYRPEPSLPAVRVLREGGCYVITGGLGKLGLVLAEAISKRIDANLILVGRSGAKTSAAREAVARIEKNGSRVIVKAMDVADRDAVGALIAEIAESFGEISGCIHAAGCAEIDKFPFLAEADESSVRQVISAKVQGALNLAHALRGRPLDFVLLCSSVSTVLGGVRFGPYAAGNAFLESVAAWRREQGDEAWLSVAWDALLFDDLAADAPGLKALAIRSDEVAEVFSRCLSIPGPVIVVSTTELNARLEDARGLAKPVSERGRTLSGGVAEAVRDAVAAVMGRCPDLGDSLISHGADSLLLMQITARIASSLKLQLPLARVYAAPTVEGIERLCREFTAGTARAEEIPARGLSEGPMSSSQERLWYLAQLEPDNPFYNVTIAWRIRGSVTEERLAAAVRRLMERHGALRTIFGLAETGAVQRVRPLDESAIRVQRLPEGDPETVLAKVSALADEDAGRPVDLEKGPVGRALIVVAPEQLHLVLTVHHIAIDGWSVRTMETELIEMLQAADAGTPARLAEPALTCCDYALWEKEQLRSPRMLEKERYWRGRLSAPLEELVLPADKPRPNGGFGPGQRQAFRLDGETLRSLEAFARAERTTLYTVMAAALNILFHRWVGREDILIGTNVANRQRPELDGLVGFLVNAVLLRQRVASDSTARQVLAATHRTVLEAMENQEFPYIRIVESLNPKRQAARSPLFSVIFQFQDERMNLQRDGHGAIGLERVTLVRQGPVKFDLSINVESSTTGLDVIVVYAADLFEAATIRDFCRDLQSLLRDIPGDPDRLVSRFDMTLTRGAQTGKQDQLKKEKFKKLSGLRRSNERGAP